MAHKVLHSLLNEVTSRKWFSFMADETKDISNREQLLLCIRSVSDSYVVHEDLVGLFQLENTTAISLHACTKDSLLRLGLMMDKCRVRLMMEHNHFKGM